MTPCCCSGRIDDIGVWTRALTVRELAQSGVWTGALSSGLAVWYDLSDCRGTRLQDRSRNHNNAVVHGSPSWNSVCPARVVGQWRADWVAELCDSVAYIIETR